MHIPIYSPIKSRDGTLSRDGFMKNAFVEKAGDSKFHCYRRPGLAQYGTNTAGVGQGITGYIDADDNEYLFQANGGTLYNAGVTILSTSWSQLTTTTEFALSSQNLIQANILYLGGYYWLIGGSSVNGTNDRFAVFYASDPDGTWTELVDSAYGAAGIPSADFYRVIVHQNMFVAVGRSGYTTWTSPDGATWTQVDTAMRSIDASIFVRNLLSDGTNLYCAFEHGSSSLVTGPLYKSTDNGATWASTGATQLYDVVNPRRNFGFVYYGGAIWVIGGTHNSGAARKVYKSVDEGATFSEVGSSTFSALHASVNIVVSWVANGVMWSMIPSSSTSSIIRNIYRSTDGITWTLATTWSASAPTPLLGNLADSGLNSFAASNGSLFRDGALYYWDSITSGANPVLLKLASSGANATTSIGSIGGGIIDFAQNYARTRLGIKTSSVLYSLNITTNTLTEVTDGDYPDETVRGIVYLDGFFFVMDKDGNIYNSAEEDLTSWDASNYLAAQFESDGGVALTKYNLYIVAFGEYTTEFFWNAGNATGSPLLPVQQGVMTIGCADGDTVGQIDSQVIWVAQSKSQGQSVAKGRFIAQLQGNSYVKISPPDIDRILDADNFSDVDATTFKVGGHAYYHLRLGGSNMSLVYDLSEAQWYVWTRRRDSFTQANLGNVVIANGTATATMTSSWADGDVGVITGFTGTYTALNGTYNFTVASNVYKWPVSFSGTATSTQTTGTATGWLEDDFGIVSAASFDGRQLLQDKSSGDLFELDIDTYQDDSLYMDWQVRLPKIDGDTNNNKFVAFADLITSKVSGSALLRQSDDDCQNFTRFRSRSMAGARTRWHRLGEYRRRVFEVRVTDNVPVRAESLQVE